MTRKEQTGKRDPFFSEWIRKNLPSSKTGFRVTDIDSIPSFDGRRYHEAASKEGQGEEWIFANTDTKKFMIVECKQNREMMREWQSGLFHFIADCISEGIKKYPNWTFYGFKWIYFQNRNFDDGKVTICGKEVTEQEAIRIFSMLE